MQFQNNNFFQEIYLKKNIFFLFFISNFHALMHPLIEEGLKKSERRY